MINLHFTDANYYGLNKLGDGEGNIWQKRQGQTKGPRTGNPKGFQELLYIFFPFFEGLERRSTTQTNRKWLGEESGEVAHLKKLNFQFMVSLSLALFSVNCSCKLKILSLDKNINFSLPFCPLNRPAPHVRHMARAQAQDHRHGFEPRPKACAEFYGFDEVSGEPRPRLGLGLRSKGSLRRVLLHIQVPKG